MPNVKLYDMKAKEVGTLELPDALFNTEYNESVIHQAVVQTHPTHRNAFHWDEMAKIHYAIPLQP